jgi:hypothetical protein
MTEPVRRRSERRTVRGLSITEPVRRRSERRTVRGLSILHRALGIALAITACGKRAPREEPGPAPEPPGPADGGAPVAADAAPAPWPELAGLPRAAPDRVLTLPTKPDVPRFTVGGPVIAGDVAVVASSQFGFIAVDWRRGAIAWTKPAGLHVAPPLVLDRGADSAVVLVGDCFTPPALPEGERLLGCLRVVTPAGVDQAYMAIHGKPAAVEPFAAAAGPQALWRAAPGAPGAPAGEDAPGRSVRLLRWRRGEQAVAVDLISGVATPVDAGESAPIVVEYKAKRWEIEHADGKLVARARRGGPVVWSTEHRYTALLGAVWQEDAAPMLRIATLADGEDSPHVRVIDMDATGSLRSANARGMPGIALLGWGASPVGDVAIAIRLDRSLRRDFIAGYAASAMVMWVYPLPEQPRPDPVGVAVTPDAVIAFHDGDTLTILPELSAPPTAPGAGKAPSRNSTP